MRRLLAALCVLAFVLTVVCTAEERFGVEYVSGHTGLPKSFDDAAIVIDDAAVRVIHGYFRKDGKTVEKVVFTIPLSTIVSATASTERENYFGVVSSNAVRNQDYVTIKAESDNSAEAVVFKVGKKQAAGIAAKIEFAAKKAKGMTE